LFYHPSCSTDEEAKSSRDEMTCPSSPAGKWWISLRREMILQLLKFKNQHIFFSKWEDHKYFRLCAGHSDTHCSSSYWEAEEGGSL
jgi:hypothetical protein